MQRPARVGRHELKLNLVECQRVKNLSARLVDRLRMPYRRVAGFVAAHLRFVQPILRLMARLFHRTITARSAESERLTEQPGAGSLTVTFETSEEAPTRTSTLLSRAREKGVWHYFPSQGVFWSSRGRPYPLFAQEAKGCRVTDVEGRQYVDYLMGFGCNLLGYANDRIQRAIRDAASSAAVISLPHHLEMEVAGALSEAIPCGEKVLFGKNGSDVCTAAVRLARAYTGRSRVLVCGYHGWQDWFVEKRGFFMSGVPERDQPLVIPFPFNDRTEFLKLMRTYRGDVAAVMLEPAGPFETNDLTGPVQDADTEFLREVAEVTRREGTLLIFDEIMTGFRYPGGSVQKATGVVPDLACLGKGLSAGMPLSALVGRELFFGVAWRTAFGPTFRGEIYSLAAAKEALAFYQEHDVPGHVWGHGNRLKQGVNQLCRKLGVAAQVIGPPFRMLMVFDEPDEHRRALMRTLVQQELLQRGVITLMGVMVPSYAHDDRALAETLTAFEGALQTLAEVTVSNAFARHLEIPPIRGL
jgi:glutamate-1-semialdehyde aminotransferase